MSEINSEYKFEIEIEIEIAEKWISLHVVLFHTMLKATKGAHCGMGTA